MNKILSLGLVLSLGACSLFSKKPDEPSNPSQPKPPGWSQGEYKDCPYEVDGEDKCGGRSGVWCLSDDHYHSVADKCHKH